MHKGRLLFRLSVCVIGLFVAASCGDDGPVEPGGDRTAPLVTGHDPDDRDSNINLDEEIVIQFNEPMDQASAAGNVAISSGTITSLDWLNDRTLSIEHTPWAEGIQVTVTLRTGLRDLAGNGLAAPYSFSFWTMSSVLVLLATDPADGATNVTRNTRVLMLFSAEMNLASLEAATTVSADGTDPAFEIERGEERWVVMRFTEVLPATTAIQVSISTDAQDMSGRNLSAAATFGFRTGTDVDTTPPQIVSFEPPNGAVISAETSFFRITFSEPIDPDTFAPERVNAEVWRLIVDSSPVWTQNYTVLTAALPAPLPAGLPMEVTFGAFADRNGVVQPARTTYTATVAGSPDYVPVVGGARYTYDRYYAEGVLGNTVPTSEGEGIEYIQIDTQPGGRFHWAEYTDGTFSLTEEWIIFRKTSTELEWIGFHEETGEGPMEVLFDPPLPYLRLPVRAGSWTATSRAIVESDTFDIDWQGNVLARERLPVVNASDLFWMDCWKVVVGLEVTREGSPFVTRADTLWYSPTVGLVRESLYEENTQENAWSREIRDLTAEGGLD